MSRAFIGNQPTDLKKNYQLAATEIDGRRWELWEINLHLNTSDEWASLKLICLDRVPKANFRFGWSRSSQRLARTRDMVILTEHYPTVKTWVEETMRNVKE